MWFPRSPVGTRSTLVVRRRYTETHDTIRGAIAIIDPATGRVRRTLELDALPDDVLVSSP